MIRQFLWLLAFLPFVAFAIDTGAAFDDPVLQARYERLIGEVRCVTCQNQSIKDSNAFLAEDLRRQIRTKIGEGASDQEIYLFLSDRYGEFALYRPRFSARTALLWVVPVALLIFGAFMLARIVRANSRLADQQEDEA